ncbi:MAG: hypothetical protein DYG92_11500 [Leptolyngbya sp. PLA1]|nr:hypothetical protein [Leptolyngbya sp. PLA1]
MSMILTACLTMVLAGGAETPAPAAGEPLKLTLISIREIRSAFVGPGDEDQGMKFGDKDGLTLTFMPDLPEGTTISAIEQPTAPKAQDNTGTDLTKIAPDFWDRLTYLEVEDFGSDEGQVTLKLGLPARRAEAVDVSISTNATVFEGVDVLDIPQPKTWTKVTHPSLARLGAEIKFVGDEDGARLLVRPAAAKEVIEGVFPATEETDQSGYSVSYDDESATFDISPPPEKDQKIRLKVRSKIDVRPVVIEIKGQKLP